MATNLKKIFAGKETPKEEAGELKAYKSGKISKKQFKQGEKMEGNSDKEPMPFKRGGMAKKGKK